MDSPSVSDDGEASVPPEEQTEVGISPNQEKKNHPAATEEESANDNNSAPSSVASGNPLVVEPSFVTIPPTAIVSSRPRSPSVFSEMSKPDPPSVIDHQVIEDILNEQDWEEEEEHECKGAEESSTSKLVEHHHVDGRIIQRALSQGGGGGDHKENSSAAMPQKPDTSSSDLADAPLPPQDTFFINGVPEQSPQDTSLEKQKEKQEEDNCQQLDKCQEPPAILKHSTSNTNLPLIVDHETLNNLSVMTEEGMTHEGMENGNQQEVEPHDDKQQHQQQQEEPPAKSPKHSHQVDTSAVGVVVAPKDPTPMAANHKQLQDNHQLHDSNNTNHHASPGEFWMDAAQTISPTPLNWGGESPTFINANQWTEETSPVTSSPRRAAVPMEAQSPLLERNSSTGSAGSHHHAAHVWTEHRHTPSRPVQQSEGGSPLPPPPLASAFAPAPSSTMSYGGGVSYNGLTSPSSGRPLLTTPHHHPHHHSNGGAPPAHHQDNGRCRIHLHMHEEVQTQPSKRNGGGLLGHFRTRSKRMIGLYSIAEQPEFVSNDRGLLSVSWFPGTTAIELQEHVHRSVIRKLRLPPQTQLVDLRVLDETVDPPEEIVLSPHIPNGSTFSLRFGLSNDGASTPGSIIRPPDSPSAAPAHQLAGLSNQQMAALTKQLDELRTPEDSNGESKKHKPSLRMRKSDYASAKEKDEGGGKERKANGDSSEDEKSDDDDDMLLGAEDPIEARLRQITELLMDDRQKKRGRRQEKRQVILVLANYFILFIGLIALSAELQARAPEWLASMEKQMKDVRDCSADQEALFECVSRGDFAGLVASVILWLSRSVIPRRIFLFGFESPKKLWTVVYESLVTAICWGVSYMFIRRGMNPDTRERFLQKYWKDAVYGSLAGFNAAFMKHVLKNLIPQEAVEDVLRDRQLRFLNWLPSFE